MEIGLVGLGAWGARMAGRLLQRNHRVYAYDDSEASVAEGEVSGAVGLSSIEELVRMRAPRTVWVNAPGGPSIAGIIGRLAGLLTAEDTIIDASFSYYEDSVERYEKLKARAINLLDVGVTDADRGPSGGFCLFIGGDQEPFSRAEAFFQSVACDDGYALVGGPGAGHFVWMVHDAVAEVLMGGYAEGFEILRLSKFSFDLTKIARLWNQGGLVRSRVLEMTERALARGLKLVAAEPSPARSETNHWPHLEIVARHTPSPVIPISFLEDLRARAREPFRPMFLAAIREEISPRTSEAESRP